MRYFQATLVIVLAALLASAGYFLFRGLGLGEDVDGDRAEPLAPGDHEIVWLMPATSSEDWTRLITAMEQLLVPGSPLERLDARLTVDFAGAFPLRGGDFPEIVVQLVGDTPGKVRLRWYKVGGQANASRWIEKLARRGQPPLAIIGGDTSNRALETARALQKIRERWQGAAPLFLMTTATAERYLESEHAPVDVPRDELPKLIDVYKGRTFRFAFTNSRMVKGVLEFVKQTPTLWRHKSSEPTTFASIAAAGSPFTSLAVLDAGGHFWPYSLLALAWQDDRYSKDLAEEFLDEFLADYRHEDPLTINVANEEVRYSAGDFFHPNPREQAAIDGLLTRDTFFRDQHALLVLPTGVQRVRRFVRGLCRQAPFETRNMVVLSGDSISFNSIYRDRDTAWNPQDLPVSLVLFSHRNPIDASAGFKAHGNQRYSSESTSTTEVLLYRDIVRTLLEGMARRSFAMDADDLRDDLRQAIWHDDVLGPTRFFDEEGNRAAGTGEHIVWLKPTVFEGRVQPTSTITVWTNEPREVHAPWRQVGILRDVRYNRFDTEE